jgi:DNA-directed RNA polymerase specialized sigma24 family protein
MKYMILTFASQQDYQEMAGRPSEKLAWTPEDYAALGTFMQAFNQELLDSGELAETRGLSAPVHSRRIRLQEGVPVVTDGPYAEAEEVLAGYWVVDCASFDRATEIASRLASCPGPEHVRLRAYADVPRDGLPNNPKGWLITVASRRLTDMLRADQARRRREDTAAHWSPVAVGNDRADERGPADEDDTLVLLFMCCHPSLSVSSQIALTLRAVGGLGVAEIARALLTSGQTVTRRITRAKQSIKERAVPFALPSPVTGRLDTVLRVLYLIFNEGYASTMGTDLLRADLAVEAIRLTRIFHFALPDESEVTGLLALMLLIHARHEARVRVLTVRSSPWTNRTAPCGTAMVSTKASRSSPPHCLAVRLGRISSRRRSPPSTTRPRAPTRPTGPRLRRSTGCCSNSMTTRSLLSITPSLSAWSSDPPPVSSYSTVWSPTPGSTAIAAFMRCAPTSSNWTATPRPR